MRQHSRLACPGLVSLKGFRALGMGVVSSGTWPWDDKGRWVCPGLEEQVKEVVGVGVLVHTWKVCLQITHYSLWKLAKPLGAGSSDTQHVSASENILSAGWGGTHL